MDGGTMDRKRFLQAAGLGLLAGCAGERPRGGGEPEYAYPRALEPSVIAPERSIELMAEIARRHGPRAVVWSSRLFWHELCTNFGVNRPGRP